MATDEELKALLGEGADPAPPEGGLEDTSKDEAPKDPPEKDPAVKAKEEHLANLNKAIESETERLQKIRTARKSGKTVEELEEEELPKINLEDPASKAWDKRIREAAAPAQQELEKAKQERRLFVLRQFLEDKPALSKSPEKLKAMMETYDRLKTSTELTNEGIQMDLEKAYAATHSDELLRAVRSSRVENARNDALLSDIGVSRGSSTYSDDKKQDTQITMTDDEKQVLAKWNMTPAEWIEMKKKYG